MLPSTLRRVPAADAGPHDITAGPDGNLWFTEAIGNNIGRITPSGTITEFPVPTGGSVPSGITAGPDGNVWFTESNGNNIGQITPSGTIAEFPIPSSGAGPQSIVAGPDGNLWFTERFANNIGRITPSGTITEFPVPTSNAQPYDITAGPDGNLWFTEAGVRAIGRITPSGTIAEILAPSNGWGITTANNTIYFSEQNQDRIDFFTPPSQIITRIDMESDYPANELTWWEGHLWFTESDGSTNIGWLLSFSGPAPEVPVPNYGDPRGITAGPDGKLWFTEYWQNKIGTYH